MPTDQLVQSKDVLDALMRIRRQGRAQVLRQLEQLEPDLAEYVMEELSRIHHRILRTGANPHQCRRLYRQCEGLTLASLLALRQGVVRLWREDMAGSRLAQIDPSMGALGSDDADDDDEPTAEHGNGDSEPDRS